MKKFFFICSFFFIAASGWAQDMERVYSVLDTLTSPSFNGRGYVGEGDKKAAQYIAKEFSTIGLQSFESGSYFQPFTFPINTFPGKLSLKVDGKYLTAGEDFIVEASSSGLKFKGKACFLDTLIFHDLAAKDRFLKEKCDKNVLVYRAEDLPKIIKLEDKYLQKFHCFKAYIELHKGKLTASVSTKQYPRVTFQVLEKSFPKEASKVEMEVEAKLIDRYNTQNVIGFIPGKEKPDSLIVFTAHYDHLGRMGKDVYFPGANDNASGISMLLELAYYYKNKPDAQKYSMVFIAFAAEEAG
ncbi:MAG TPA: M28 family peptidase, partial [Cytophagales bacterium]|nr:M28 family peptidase [Cytophagales bacterium]